MTNLKINNRPGTTFIGTFDKYKNQEDTSKAKYIAHYIPFPPHPCASNTKADNFLFFTQKPGTYHPAILDGGQVLIRCGPGAV